MNHMTGLMAQFLGQLKHPDAALPSLREEGSLVVPWLIGAFVVAGVVLLAFKQSKRNRTLEDQ